MKYRRKELVEAIQWTGKNADEMAKFLDMPLEAKCVLLDSDVTTANLTFFGCALNDWLVKHEDGYCSYCSDEEFKQKYEKVKQKNQ